MRGKGGGRSLKHNAAKTNDKRGSGDKGLPQEPGWGRDMGRPFGWLRGGVSECVRVCCGPAVFFGMIHSYYVGGGGGGG